MNFLSPAMLFGLLGALIPPLIHLIHKRKAVVRRFPALEFIHRSNKKTQRRFKARQLLLMSLRSLLMAALAFALARPFFESAPTAASAAGGGATTTIVVLDATWPMGFKIEGETLLDRARFQADNLLSELSGRSGLVIAGHKVLVPMAEPTGAADTSRRYLEDVELSSRFGTLPEAVSRAYEMLASEPGAGRVVVLTTAASAASALPQPPPATSGGGIELVPVDVSAGIDTPNRAVLDVQLRPAPQLGEGHWRVDARIGNYSAEAVRRLPIWLEVDGKIAVRAFADIPPGGEVVKTFHARIDTRQAATAAVVIEGDALPADDRRAFWLQPAPKVKVLAVNGDPRPTPHLDELFYLERAMAPRTAAGTRVQLTITGVDALDRYPKFDAFDVLVLANLPDFPSARAAELETFVRGGGGLFVSVGDQVKPARLNSRLGGLLPRTLRDTRQAGDAAASAEGRDRRSARISLFNRDHPIMRPFPDPAGTSLGATRVRRYMLLDPAPQAEGEVVLGLNDGAPFLLTRPVGQGRVALLTASLDRDWGDLPIRADFLPLMQQILRYLTRVAEVDTTPVLVGHPATIPVDDARARRVRIQTPDGGERLSERPRGKDDPWQFTDTLTPGHYTVQPDPPMPGLVALPGFAVAVDGAGSDLRGTAAEGTPAEQNAAIATLTGGKRSELWHTALFGLFLLLLGEGAVLFRQKNTLFDPEA